MEPSEALERLEPLERLELPLVLAGALKLVEKN
jgi:hypothetical protein